MPSIVTTVTGEAELDEATADALQLADGGREPGVGGVTWAPRPDSGLELVRSMAVPCASEVAQCVSGYQPAPTAPVS